jgi:hypothetical protein
VGELVRSALTAGRRWSASAQQADADHLLRTRSSHIPRSPAGELLPTTKHPGSETARSRWVQLVEPHGPAAGFGRLSGKSIGLGSVARGGSVGKAKIRFVSSAYSHRTGLSVVPKCACRWFASVPGHHFQLDDSQRVPGLASGQAGAVDGGLADCREVGGQRRGLSSGTVRPATASVHSVT